MFRWNCGRNKDKSFEVNGVLVKFRDVFGSYNFEINFYYLLDVMVFGGLLFLDFFYSGVVKKFIDFNFEEKKMGFIFFFGENKV